MVGTSCLSCSKPFFPTAVLYRTFLSVLIVTTGAVLFPCTVFAEQAVHAAEAGATAHVIAPTLLAMALVLLAARFASLVEHFGQPSVLGELVIGVVLGNLGLLGIHVFDFIETDAIMRFLAELGVVILLFQIGLESDIQRMMGVGVRALLVASVGVVVPFVLGTYVVGPLVFPGLSLAGYLFIGAALTATSVGITARVFRDLGQLQSSESQIVLGAAVIDDVMGLIILAVVSAIATEGSVGFGNIVWITSKALLFLIGSIVLGQILAPRLGKIFSMINTGVGMKFTLAICFGLVCAGLAQFIGLAPIVGAFAAGLVLDPVHFRYFKDPHIVTDIRHVLEGADTPTKERILRVVEPHARRHIEDLIEPISLFLVPIFFVMTGMTVQIETLFDSHILLVALAITATAFAGKIVSGLVAGKVQKWIVGFGMVPRGEVGLIFASIGLSLGVLKPEAFSVIVVMVLLTTLLTPPILTFLLKRQPRLQQVM